MHDKNRRGVSGKRGRESIKKGSPEKNCDPPLRPPVVSKQVPPHKQAGVTTGGFAEHLRVFDLYELRTAAAAHRKKHNAGVLLLGNYNLLQHDAPRVLRPMLFEPTRDSSQVAQVAPEGKKQQCLQAPGPRVGTIRATHGLLIVLPEERAQTQ